MKFLFLLAALLPLVLANRCLGPTACIFDLETSETYKALTKSLQETKRRADVTRIFAGMMQEIKRLSRVEEKEPFPNYDTANSYIQSKYDFARKQMRHINIIAKEKLRSNYLMERQASDDKRTVDQQYRAVEDNLVRIDYDFFEEVRAIYEHLENINNSYWVEIERKAAKLRKKKRIEEARLEEERRQALEREMMRQEEEHQRLEKLRREAEWAAAYEKMQREIEERKAQEYREARTIPDDPKTKITLQERNSFLNLDRMMDILKEPTAEEIQALDDFALDSSQ